MDVSARVLAAVADVSQPLSSQLLRHGVCDVLVQDVLRSASAWLPAAGTKALKHMLVPNTAEEILAPDTHLQLPCLHLSGDQIDGAFTTLRLLNKRLAALSSMAHEPSSCSTTPDVIVNAQSWLVGHKAVQLRHYWQYGYSLRFQNTAQEPLQLLRKAWTVQDMTGSSRHRESTRLLGLQPIIEPSGSLSCKTAITLNSIKVPAFALTPSALQLSDPQITDVCGVLMASPAATTAQ